MTHLSEILLRDELLLLRLVLSLQVRNLIQRLLNLLHILLNRLLFPIITSFHRDFLLSKLGLNLISLLNLVHWLRNYLLDLLLLYLLRNLKGNLLVTLGGLRLVLRQGLLLVVTGFHREDGSRS